MASPEWIADSVKHHGLVLNGAMAHWCPTWDYMPIDETTPEFSVCDCTLRNMDRSNPRTSLNAIEGDK